MSRKRRVRVPRSEPNALMNHYADLHGSGRAGAPVMIVYGGSEISGRALLKWRFLVLRHGLSHVISGNFTLPRRLRPWHPDPVGPHEVGQVRRTRLQTAQSPRNHGKFEVSARPSAAAFMPATKARPLNFLISGFATKGIMVYLAPTWKSGAA